MPRIILFIRAIQFYSSEGAIIPYYAGLMTSGAAGTISPNRANATLCLTRTESKGMFSAVTVVAIILGAVSVSVDSSKVIVALSLISKKTRTKVSSQWQNVLGD